MIATGQPRQISLQPPDRTDAPNQNKSAEIDFSALSRAASGGGIRLGGFRTRLERLPWARFYAMLCPVGESQLENPD